ncbi:hypothetical protein DFJ73DRAFT_844587 [Zopfochytrium polystomum]|nr:hypothetical protein DFJ73DRAFT_844587 [Zopfochytrium polystomum]
MTSPFLLRVANTLVYLFFLGTNIYSTYGHEGDLYDDHQTYLSPANFVFYAWGLIHILFGGFVIWQWFPETEEIVEHAFGAWFAVAGLLVAVQLDLWKSGDLIFSLFTLIFALLSVSVIYYNLATSYPGTTPAQHILVHAPVSLFHGWLVFIFWLNLMAIFTSVQDPKHPDLLHSALAFFVMVKLSATASSYTEWRHDSGDVAGAGVIAWALFAISYGQPAPFISWSAFILAWWVTIHTIFRPAQFVWKLRSASGEQQPLLGEQQA